MQVRIGIFGATVYPKVGLRRGIYRYIMRYNFRYIQRNVYLYKELYAGKIRRICRYSG